MSKLKENFLKVLHASLPDLDTVKDEALEVAESFLLGKDELSDPVFPLLVYMDVPFIRNCEREYFLYTNIYVDGFGSFSVLTDPEEDQRVVLIQYQDTDLVFNNLMENYYACTNEIRDQLYDTLPEALKFKFPTKVTEELEEAPVETNALPSGDGYADEIADF